MPNISSEKLTIMGLDFSKPYEYENGFYLTTDSSRLAKSIAHWELYKQITDLPGSIVECGVFKGASLIRFATFREMLESQESRKIIGFDAFGKFPDTGEFKGDRDFISCFESRSGVGLSKSDLEKIIIRKQFRNVELIEGNIIDTIPKFIKSFPQTRISLLHIDVDVYEATKAVLEHFYDLVVKDGIIVFDDYTSVNGGTKAIDEFFERKSINALIRKLPYYAVPSYIIKV